MDNWQKKLHKRLDEFTRDCTSSLNESCEPIKISVNVAEAYVLMRALEDQQRYLNPITTVET